MTWYKNHVFPRTLFPWRSRTLFLWSIV